MVVNLVDEAFGGKVRGVCESDDLVSSRDSQCNDGKISQPLGVVCRMRMPKTDEFFSSLLF